MTSHFISQGQEIRQILGLLQIPSSRHGPRPRPSTHTRTRDGWLLANQEVVRRIEDLLQQDFADYGYIKVTHWLRQNLNVIISFRKVYRLMKENKLLYRQHLRGKKGKTFVKFRVLIITLSRRPSATCTSFRHAGG